MYHYVGMKISVLRNQLQYMYMYAVYIGAHVVIMFPCESHNYN